MEGFNNKRLWEILVPRYSSEGEEYSVAYHRAWDEQVRSIAGGVTILRTAKGHWIAPDGELFVEEMIPVRIHCTESELDQIIDHTLQYYNQRAVFAYEVSSNVKIRSRGA